MHKFTFQLTTHPDDERPVYLAGNFNDWEVQDENTRMTSLGDGPEAHESWRDREWQHQRARRKRKARADRAAAVQQAQQPGAYVSIKQPDLISLSQWPTLPQLKSQLASTYQARRVLTSGGDHAELYFEKAKTGARGTEHQFKEQVEALTCSEPRYLTAEEKL